MTTTQAQRVTLFCAPKPFTGHNRIIQRNALASWKALGPRVTVLLLGNDTGVAEAAREFGYTHIPDIACTEYGTPRLDDLFRLAQAAATTPFMCYINADIMLPPSFLSGLELTAAKWADFLLIGRRWDVDVTEELNGFPDWSSLDRLRREHGVLHGPWGMDYFGFPRGMIQDMPPFAIGRPGWDGWLIWTTAKRGIPLVNATECVPAIHQNHDYAHVPGALRNCWEGSPEAERNRALIAANDPDIESLCCSVFRAPWRLGADGPERDLSLARINWHLWLGVTLSRRWVWTRVIRLLRRILRPEAYDKLRNAWRSHCS